jgi:hypothetical protein
VKGNLMLLIDGIENYFLSWPVLLLAILFCNINKWSFIYLKVFLYANLIVYLSVLNAVKTSQFIQQSIYTLMLPEAVLIITSGKKLIGKLRTRTKYSSTGQVNEIDIEQTRESNNRVAAVFRPPSGKFTSQLCLCTDAPHAIPAAKQSRARRCN